MATIAQDVFTGSIYTELSAHNANWAKHTASSSTRTCILSTENRLRRGSTDGNTVLYYRTENPGSADYKVSATLFSKSDGGGISNTGVVGRCDTSAITFYHARSSDSATNLYQLYRFVAGTATLLGSSSRGTWGDEEGRAVALHMQGTSIALHVNGSSTPIVTATDSAITAAGKAGVRFSGGTAETDSFGMHLDDWIAETFEAAAPAINSIAASNITQTGATITLGLTR